MTPTCDNPKCGKPNPVGVDRCVFCNELMVTEIMRREYQRMIG